MYSIIETAKENGLTPYAYLQWLFETMPQLDDLQDPATLDRLLPWSESIPQDFELQS
ncbi:MAG TPA: transposase domain-containing protein [Symbiobacteriaceae bacterium]|nr:transposase domain-containing protein [Symbiobacteriaceae bacterium]